MCGEYGGKHGRPHYHCILFGFSPEDRKFYRKGDSGFDTDTSQQMTDLWEMGQVYVGDFSFESASYVARYALKKADERKLVGSPVDVVTGEIDTRKREYCKMSLRPAIGRSFFFKYFADMFPHDRVVVRGSESPVPKYYRKLLDEFSPLYGAEMKSLRVELASAAYEKMLVEFPELRFGDLRRLKVHEVVKRAAIKSLKRSL